MINEVGPRHRKCFHHAPLICRSTPVTPHPLSCESSCHHLEKTHTHHKYYITRYMCVFTFSFSQIHIYIAHILSIKVYFQMHTQVFDSLIASDL